MENRKIKQIAKLSFIAAVSIDGVNKYLEEKTKKFANYKKFGDYEGDTYIPKKNSKKIKKR